LEEGRARQPTEAGTDNGDAVPAIQPFTPRLTLPDTSQ
jgi:hypothetical protein